MAAKKAADQILDTERQKAEEPILNKQILQALTNHAHQMAKIALDSHGSGFDLVKDIKVNKAFFICDYNLNSSFRD
jgi:hypothetical protein